jgi:hypothetical protein
VLSDSIFLTVGSSLSFGAAEKKEYVGVNDVNTEENGKLREDAAV